MKFYKESHNYGKAVSHRTTAFKPSETDQYLAVNILWGLKNQDLSKCHYSDHECTGDTVYDDAFDLTLPEAQIAMLVSTSKCTDIDIEAFMFLPSLKYLTIVFLIFWSNVIS